MNPVRAGAFLVVVLLAGCASVPTDPQVQRAAWQSHQQWLAQLESWRSSGKLAVDLPADSFSANLRWRQAGPSYRIWLGGPFGQGAVTIEGDAEVVSLRTSDGRRAVAPTPEALLAAEVGVAMPVSRLRHWILGRPDPRAPVDALVLDEEGRLATLEQSGWLVRYGDYQDVEGGQLPARLELTRGEVRARFVLARWRTPA